MKGVSSAIFTNLLIVNNLNFVFVQSNQIIFTAVCMTINNSAHKTILHLHNGFSQTILTLVNVLNCSSKHGEYVHAILLSFLETEVVSEETLFCDWLILQWNKNTNQSVKGFPKTCIRHVSMWVWRNKLSKMANFFIKFFFSLEKKLTYLTFTMSTPNNLLKRSIHIIRVGRGRG